MNIRAAIREAEREAAYQYALALARWLDPYPGLNFCRRVNGRRCHTLDEAVRELEQCSKEPKRN